MAAIAQTITIVDRSNKVVSSTKQLKNVFKEAKVAYLERKAEITAERKRKEEHELQKAIKAMSIAEEEERRSQRGDSTHRRRSRPEDMRRHSSQRPRGPDLTIRPPTERNDSASSVRSAHSRSPRSAGSRSPAPQGSPHQMSLDQFNDELYGRPGNVSPGSPRQRSLGQFNDELYGGETHPYSAPPSPNGLVRSRTDGLELTRPTHRPPPVRSRSMTEDESDVDMDLAYGEYHPTALVRTREPDEKELSSLVVKCKMMLDEANCAQHSVKAIIMHLQKNPDAMAAVALTLAEISNIATKMAPGALMAFKSSAPAVLALLASPQFLIAVGVGVGVTVVAFGGYKIVKKIQDKIKDGNGEAKEGSMDEMLEVRELSRIDAWRRGIADTDGLVDNDMETASVISGTSVEGEFITPFAAASMGHLPLKQKKEKKEKSKDSKDKDKKHKKHRKRDGDGHSESGSVQSEESRRSVSRRSTGDNLTVSKDKALVKVKKPSPLRRMFTSSRDGSSVAS